MKSLDSSEFSLEFSDLKTLLSNVKVNPVSREMDTTHFIKKIPSNSQDFTTPQIYFEFSGFYYTTNSFLIKPLHTNDRKTRPFREILSVVAERKRRGQGGVMWTEYHKRSDANHIGWINLIQSNTTHGAKLGLMRVQESYIDTFFAQVAAPGLFGGFSFHGLKELNLGDS